jgi:pimeloyl-ACP methyl ester carboxylesterase
MTTFVLVHGAWGGSWGWREFANLLRADGHEVYTPSLTGQGERIHLGGPQVDLTTHVTDVENTFFYDDLTDVTLVGHSYGGMVITAVVDRIPERVRHLVYLDAFLPRDGESCFDLQGAGGRDHANIEDGWKVMPIGPRPVEPISPEDAHRMARVAPQPVGTFSEKVRLSVPLEDWLFSPTYVKAAGDMPGDLNRTSAFWQASARTKADPRWRYHELPCGHGIQREMPHELKAILDEVIAG